MSLVAMMDKGMMKLECTRGGEATRNGVTAVADIGGEPDNQRSSPPDASFHRHAAQACSGCFVNGS